MMRIQKMENLETLASGVAHEFNNIFTGIKGLTDLIRDEVDATSEIYEFADGDPAEHRARRGPDPAAFHLRARDAPQPAPRMISRLPQERPAADADAGAARGSTLELDIRADGDVLIDPQPHGPGAGQRAAQRARRDGRPGQGPDHRRPRCAAIRAWAWSSWRTSRSGS